ncbi:unnamed protein product [Plasmodium vivax]|uniref:(malaria parasite P. vivax) hypothetical protein n=1 Tax=Plasmodium vivax TaxID=5855 RepID=A0A8S4H7Y1_PLAVI|nr:unnamed protein product [Plasmodium vivax]
MSNACDGHIGQYFKYDCYIRLRNYFEPLGSLERDNGILKQYIESLQNNKGFVNKYYELFKLLSNRFGGDGLFMTPGPYVCCPYLNYWLNYKITYDYNELRGNNLQVFKEFADFYAKKRSETYYKDNSCSEYIKPLYDNNYNKMEILYKMYDLYNLNTRYDAKFHKDTICINYGLINNHYNNLKEIYTSDDYLKAKLADFINIINNSKNSVKAVCKYEILPPVSRHEDSKQAPDSPNESDLHPPKESPGPVTQTLSDDHSEVLAEARIEEPHAVDLHNVRTDQFEPRAAQSQVVESQKAELLDAALREGSENIRSGTRSLPGLSGFRYQNEDMLGESIEHPDGEMGKSSYGLRNTESGYSNTGDQLSTSVGDTKGFFSNVQDTFFSIVKDVEPGPVLGVSGGMGVLFILFKVFKVLKL